MYPLDTASQNKFYSHISKSFRISFQDQNLYW